MRYFPLKPRLQRLFFSKESSKVNTWHATGQTKNGKLRHPADAEAWKIMDAMYPDYSSEIRIITLGNNNWYQSKLLKHKEFKITTNSKMNKKDVGVKIPFLDKDNYHHWKVKMHLYLLSQDEAYVDCIERGPHVPMRAAIGNEPSVPKPRHEWSDPDIEQVRKKKKAMNILFNGVDGDMFDNIINCKTTKEVWDTIQIICDGTEQVRENKMQLLIQQYEHFHFEEADGLDEDEDVSYVNLALMAKSDETKTSYSTWKKNKEKLESNLVEGLLTDVDSTDDESHPSDNQKDYPSSDINPHPSAVSKPVSKAKLAKLNEKYGPVSKNFISGETSQVKKEKKVNVGHLSIKQLNDRL
ncbi:hypothetical protein AgCh_031896 [Apium graveolens]